ncbi:hypothetical protein ATE84_4033 [Aquimarina sp. MAR_2010_214]|uniref:hypothetical protein n=1 Tax=Aquimarina sp. MAR_2010_214 TaxID=1250026 RepID=UPI000C709A0B|nr:hypothetical protein [Aquimarina sp. MAR_2010_214]PKV51933.1 hypothetical protein ATE84_4033 [Aquimarina sp. MAR_2010_214]
MRGLEVLISSLTEGKTLVNKYDFDDRVYLFIHDDVNLDLDKIRKDGDLSGVSPPKVYYLNKETMTSEEIHHIEFLDYMIREGKESVLIDNTPKSLESVLESIERKKEVTTGNIFTLRNIYFPNVKCDMDGLMDEKKTFIVNSDDPLFLVFLQDKFKPLGVYYKQLSESRLLIEPMLSSRSAKSD